MDRLARMKLSVEGLSLGDAFGEMFFGSPRSAREVIRVDRLPPGPWWYTDDTEMALAVVEVLLEFGEINQNALAERFGLRFLENPDRGYGKGSRIFCEWLNRGVSWQEAATMTFKTGSKGNGSAMRVAPLGAYFADECFTVIAEQASLSAIITHKHPEGIAGAIAISIAAAIAWREKNLSSQEVSKIIFESVLKYTPDSETKNGIAQAASLNLTTEPSHAAKLLGNGTLVTCPDTVPYCLWSACRHLDNYSEAILNTLDGGGDTDTNCAIVGGIVSLFVGHGRLPAVWLERREKIKTRAFMSCNTPGS